MGTRGVIYIYYRTGTRNNHVVLFLRYDSRTELLRIRREFMKLKSLKAAEKLVEKLEQDSNIEDITETSPDCLDANDCWPHLEYSLEVTIREECIAGKYKFVTPVVELVHEVCHHDLKTEQKTHRPFFSPIKGQHKQDRRTPQEKAQMKRDKLVVKNIRKVAA